MRHGRVPRLVLVALVTGVAIGCVTEKPAPPQSSIDAKLDWELAADRPQAVRALRFAAVPGSEPLSSIDLHVATDAPGSDLRKLPDLWISMVDPTTGGLPAGAGFANAGPFGSNQSGECPTVGCEQTIVIVSRWMTPTADATLPVLAQGFLKASAKQEAAPDDPSFALTRQVVEEDAAFRSDDPFTVEEARAAGHERVVATGANVSRSFRLRASAEAVAIGREYPRITRLRFWSTTTGQSQSEARGDGKLSVGDDTTLFSSGYGGTELDWLDRCPETGACEIPLTMTWSFLTATPGATASLDAWVEVDWRLDARLEALDGSPLPTNALSLEAVETP